MTGELADEKYEASVILEPNVHITDTESLAKIIESMDLPTRLLTSRPHKDAVHKPVWTGFIKARTVAGRNYPATHVSVTNIPFDKQIVIDGHLCSSEHIDGEGNCLFDRRRVIATSNKDADAHKSQSQKDNETSPVPSVNEEPIQLHSSNTDKKECPVCAYMKQGPCRTEFLAWDSCLDKLEKENLEMSACMSTTMVMMGCMRQHEYYDIMTAGTHEKYAAMTQTESQIAENQKKEQQQQQ